LRAELVKRLEQLDFRAESLDQAFAETARRVERTIRQPDSMSARLVFRSAHRVLLWKLTSSSWRTRTLPADNLDDPEVYLLAKGLAEVVDGRLRATRAGHELRKQMERLRKQIERDQR
jgi:hypothetical protein